MSSLKRRDEVSRDPTFFQAYCQLAWVHDVLYFLGYDERLRGWPWQRRQFRQRFASGRTRAKRTSHARKIFIADTSITIIR
jgi:hypothetical protein